MCKWNLSYNGICLTIRKGKMGFDLPWNRLDCKQCQRYLFLSGGWEWVGWKGGVHNEKKEAESVPQCMYF